MSKVTIEQFKIREQSRGSATSLASFSVNFSNIFIINGFELVRTSEGVLFVSQPHRRYKLGEDWKNFYYVWFSDGKGKELLNEIVLLAKEEYARRAGEQPPVEEEVSLDEMFN